MNTTSVSSSRSFWPGWAVCLLLVMAIGTIGWLAWSDYEKNLSLTTSTGLSPEEKAALEKLRHERSALAENLAALNTLLNADPCDIPVSARGFSLLPDEAPATPKAPVVQPSSPESNQEPPRGQRSVSGEAVSFSAENSAIEAATALVMFDTHEGGFMGTGFFVAPGVLATNRHVVEKSNGSVMVINAQMGITHGTVIAVSQDEERDYALVRVRDTGNLPMSLPLCGDVKKTDKVATWGYPGILSEADPKFQALRGGDLSAIPEEVYSEGVVNVVYDTMPPMILHTAVTSHGNSGGPLVNADGCVVGVNTMIQQDNKSYRQTSVALASKDLATFLWQNGITPRYRSEARQVKP